MPPHSPAKSPDPGSDHARRLRYLELDSTDEQHLAELAEVLSPHLEQILGNWHEFLLGHPTTARILRDSRGGGHLLDIQHSYFLTLFTAPTDAAYFTQRTRVGQIHHRIGLEPFWYLGAYRKFLNLVRDHLADQGHLPSTVTRWVDSLGKRVTLDLALALDAYQEREQETLRATSRELERQMRFAREALLLKQEFLSRVSHKVRSPLHAILGFADLVADGIQGPVTDAQRESLTKVRRHGERLAVMFDQLIEAAELSAAAAPEPAPFDLAPLLMEAVAVAGDEASRKGLEFTTSIPRPLPRVLGDRRYTGVALHQLLDNAVRFTATGTVRLDISRCGDHLRIAVQDSGPGIPADQINHVFEPFYQIDGSNETADTMNVGMGLSLACEAMQRSGGSLKLEHTGPQGSTFVLELGLAPAEPG